jgi:hypothetical protein
MFGHQIYCQHRGESYAMVIPGPPFLDHHGPVQNVRGRPYGIFSDRPITGPGFPPGALRFYRNSRAGSRRRATPRSFH